MGERAIESLVHGLVAITTVIALLHALPVRAHKDRFRFWLLALAYPVLAPTIFWLTVPFRSSQAFRDDWALVAVSRSSLLGWSGFRPASWLGLALAVAGTVLFLRDLVPFMIDALRARSGRSRDAQPSPALASVVDRVAATYGIARPRLRVRADRSTMLACRGLVRPTLVVSAGLPDMLSIDELEASIAHEMAHAKARDPLLGWVLMLVRTMFFFNPMVQLAARAAAIELEFAADERAADHMGQAQPVIQGLRKLAGLAGVDAEAGQRSGLRALRLAAIARRCQALSVRSHGIRVARATGSLVAVAVGLGVILFLTVV
jgi:Zn-dependent protease with chaperone function